MTRMAITLDSPTSQGVRLLIGFTVTWKWVSVVNLMADKLLCRAIPSAELAKIAYAEDLRSSAFSRKCL
jgi:hypothetical protein